MQRALVQLEDRGDLCQEDDEQGRLVWQSAYEFLKLVEKVALLGG